MSIITERAVGASNGKTHPNGRGTASPLPADGSPDQLVRSAAHGDAPASTWETDYLGFTPYVEQVRDFLLNESTETPLCMSVEGKWGSGKSSFLRQLQATLKADGAKTVLFEAWRHNSDESMWASFALESIKQLRRDRTLGWSLRAAAALGVKRIDWAEAWFKIAELALRLALFAFFTLAIVWYFFHGGADRAGEYVAKLAQAKPDDVLPDLLTKVGGGVAYLFLTIVILKNVRDLIGDPFDADLAKIMADPGYRSKLGFAEKFHRDLTNLLQAYANDRARSSVASDGRQPPRTEHVKKTFFFIDDLDRCDVPAIASLIQAINVIASTETSGAIFIIAMDRQVVAASLALKYEKLVPLITFADDKADGDVLLRRGLDYGSAFMEKFVQLPFRVPSADADDLERMTKGDKTETRSLQPYEPRAKAGVDSERILTLQREIAFVFEYNPRRIKQFGNMYRLNLLISSNPKVDTVVTHDYQDGTTPELSVLTVEKLGKWLALILCWPRFVERLSQNRTLLADLQRHALNPLCEVRGEALIWAADPTLMRLLRVDWTDYYGDGFTPERRTAIFSLEAINVDALLRLAPPIGALQQEWTARDPHVESELVLDTFKPCGFHCLVQSTHGSKRQNLELIVPAELGGLAHFVYDRDGARESWKVRTALDVTDKFGATAHIESNYDDGNLELIALPAEEPRAAAPAVPAAHKASQVRFFWRLGSNAASWKGPYAIGVSATGKPLLFQDQSGTQGDFVLLAQTTAGLLEYRRDNKRVRREWRKPDTSSVVSSKTAQPLAVYQVNAGAANMELRAVILDNGDLQLAKRSANCWAQPETIYGGISASPAVLVRSLDPSKLDVVRAEGGKLVHLSYDLSVETWRDVGTIDSGLGEIEAIHGTYGPNDRLDLVVRVATDLLHYFVAGRGQPWQGPLNIVEQIRSQMVTVSPTP